MEILNQSFSSLWTNGITIEESDDIFFENEYTNKGKNDSIGAELEAFYSINPFAFDLGFSFVKSRALNMESPEDPSETVDRYYRTFPEYSINAGIYYTLKPVNINFYLNNIVHLNIREAPDDVKPNPDSLPQYYRMDLNINKLISEKLELYLNIRNLLNRENHKPSNLGAINGYVEPGISVMLRAGYKL